MSNARAVRFVIDHNLGLVKGLDTKVIHWLGGKETVSARFGIADQLPEMSILEELIQQDVKALYLLPNIPGIDEIKVVMGEHI